MLARLARISISIILARLEAGSSKEARSWQKWAAPPPTVPCIGMLALDLLTGRAWSGAISSWRRGMPSASGGGVGWMCSVSHPSSPKNFHRKNPQNKNGAGTTASTGN